MLYKTPHIVDYIFFKYRKKVAPIIMELLEIKVETVTI